MLKDLFKTFPFVGDPTGLSRSVALAGLIGAVLRPTLPSCPLMGVTAPAAGTGKTYLVDVISIIATGRPTVGVATGAKPEEFEKSLGAALLQGRPLLSLDNIVLPLQGQLLCMTLSQERVEIRLLGLSKNVEVPTSAALFATANNLRVMGDMARRALLCRLDAGVERPEARKFDGDLLIEARARRADLVSAVLTIARRHQARRDPTPFEGRDFAGFETWCTRVRDPLLELGHPDPVMALDVTRGADLEVSRLGALMGCWNAKFGNVAQTCGEAIKTASEQESYGELRNSELCDALAAVTGDKPGAINSRKLSSYLARIEGRIVDGHRFQRDPERNRTARWMLATVTS